MVYCSLNQSSPMFWSRELEIVVARICCLGLEIWPFHFISFLLLHSNVSSTRLSIGFILELSYRTQLSVIGCGCISITQCLALVVKECFTQEYGWRLVGLITISMHVLFCFFFIVCILQDLVSS